jgi:hypothetical protein
MTAAERISRGDHRQKANDRIAHLRYPDFGVRPFHEMIESVRTEGSKLTGKCRAAIPKIRIFRRIYDWPHKPQFWNVGLRC